MTELWRRLQYLLRKRQFDRELDEELQFHVEMSDRRQFGNPTLLKEISRDMWGWGWLERLLQDLRFALRSMRGCPGFASVVILCLALGIGANTAIFSVIDAILLRMLPVRDPRQLVFLTEPGREKGDFFRYAMFEQLRSRGDVFSGLCAVTVHSQYWNVNAASGAEAARGILASGNSFQVLGVGVILGRAFTEQDTQPVAVLSYAFWQRRFGGDPSVIGRIIGLNGSPFTVIGVAPPSFFGVLPGENPDVWVPIRMASQVLPGRSANDLNIALLVFGRIKPGLPLRQAEAKIQVLFQQLLREESGGKLSLERDRELRQRRLAFRTAARGFDPLARFFSKPLVVLAAIVALVLLIACSNVANLLLARASARQREIAIRLAIGASRARIIRQLLTESLVYALTGGVVGVAFARFASGLIFRQLSAESMIVLAPSTLDLPVLAFSSGLSLITVVLFGLVPALQAVKASRLGGLRPCALSIAPGKVLVTAQVALSLVLVIGAGLFVRTLRNLTGLDGGFRAERVLLFTLDPTLRGYRDGRVMQLYRDLLGRIESLQGVESASMSRSSLLSGRATTGGVSADGDATDVYINDVGPRFFETMGIPIIAGREFHSRDDAHSTKVAVINESLARRFFGTDSPIGRKLNFSDSAACEIVGLARDSKYDALRSEAPMTVYLPMLQLPDLRRAIAFEVRTSGDPARAAGAIRQAVESIDKDLLLYDVKTQLRQLDESLIQERLIAGMSSVFGLVSLLLACVGLYGVMAYSVARRTREIGVRMALGAHRTLVLRQILTETLWLAGAGVAVGLPAALASARVARGLLFGLDSSDPSTILMAVGCMFMAALLAGYLPARRASRVDPMEALKYE